MLDKIYDHNLVHIAQTSYEVYWATNASDKVFWAEIVLCLFSVRVFRQTTFAIALQPGVSEDVGTITPV
jgi:hypothetical protein